MPAMSLRAAVYMHCLILLALCISWASAAAPWAASDFPNPQTDSQACGRGDVKSWVCDPDGVLSVQEANVVEGMLKDIALAQKPYPKSQCGTQETPGFQVCFVDIPLCCFHKGSMLQLKILENELHVKGANVVCDLDVHMGAPGSSFTFRFVADAYCTGYCWSALDTNGAFLCRIVLGTFGKSKFATAMLLIPNCTPTSF